MDSFRRPALRVWREKLAGALVLLCAASMPALAAVSVDLGSAAARPGETTDITAVLVADPEEQVAAVQLDLAFDPNLVAIAARADGRPDCEVESQIDKGASGFGFRPSGCDPLRRRCSRVHAVIVATDNVEPVADGSVLYRCRIAVPLDAPMGRHVIRGSRVLYSPPEGRDRAAAVTDAAVTVFGQPVDTPTPASTSTPRNMPTRGGSGSGGGCQLGDVRDGDGFMAVLMACGTLVLLIRRCPVPSRRLRGLWSANITVVGAVLAGGPSAAGAVVSIDIGSTGGYPGERVAISVRLTADGGELVAATQNDLRYDPAVAALAALADGTPDCAVNPAIDKAATAFGFRPTACLPQLGECTAVRAIVLAFDNTEAIVDGAVLYTCQLLIAPTASPGEYVLDNTRAGYAPPAGGDRTAAGRSGLLVIQAAPTPTPAPTDTPAPTSTMQTPGPSVTPAGPADTNCDGRIDRDDQRAVVAAIFTRVQPCNADCNRDGEITGTDLVCVTHHGLAAGGAVAGRFTRGGRSKVSPATQRSGNRKR